MLLVEFLCIYQGAELPGDRITIGILIGVAEMSGAVFSELIKLEDHTAMKSGTIIILAMAYIIWTRMFNEYLYYLIGI